MEAKQVAIAGVATAAVAGLGWATKRFFQKRAIKKALTPEVIATAEQAMELSRLNANNELIATLKGVAAAKGNVVRTELQVVFEDLYDSIRTLLDFDPRWKNGTGYFNGAMTVGLAKGNFAKATGDCGRRIIMLGTEHGTAVFFERYTIGHGPFVVVHNTATQLRELVPSGNLDKEAFTTVIAELTK
jgi:hypothetical protein